MNKVKEEFSKQHKEDIKDNSYWASRMQRSIELGTPVSNILTFDDRLKALTTQDLQEAARTYFNINNYFQAVLYPEK